MCSGMWKKMVAVACLVSAQATIAAETSLDLHLIVKYKSSISSLKSVKQQLLSVVTFPIKSINPMAGNAYTVTFSHSTNNGQALSLQDALQETLTRLHADPQIAYAIEDRVSHFNPFPEMNIAQPDDPEIGALNHALQWDEFAPPGGVFLESAPGLLDGAWGYSTGKAASPIVVAVLDTGVALNDSLVNNLVKDEYGQVFGWNFAGNNRDVGDETPSFHGTHVAGTIAAYGDVVTGVGQHLKILPLKIPDASGMFYESQVINAIYWSVGGDVPGIPHNPYPASVLNMSFGIDEKPGKEVDHCDEALQEAMFFAQKRGAVIAVAAGNDNHWEHYNAPGICNGALKVASVGPEGLRAYYSNYGPSITFAAPGGDLHYGKKGGILSTVKPGGGYLKTGFDFYQGTSMATPHAAGIAGLIYAVSNHEVTPERVAQIMYATTHAFGVSPDVNKSCVGEKPCGHGILNAMQAVRAVMAHYDVIASAPSYQQMDMKSCGNNNFTPQQKHSYSNETRWKLVKTACAPLAQYAFSEIRQEKDGAIRAYYGETVYALNKTSFSHCEVIGVDGIGCYY